MYTELVKEIFLLNSQGRSKECLQILKAELEKTPNDFYIHYLFGYVYRTINDFDNAIMHYEKSVRYNISLYFVFDALGIAYQLKGNFDKAVENLKKSIDINPYAISSYNSIGLTYKKSGNTKYAFNAYQTGVHKLIENIIKDYAGGRSPQTIVSACDLWFKCFF